MLLIDADAGIFAWSRPRNPHEDYDDDEPVAEERSGTLLTQLWAPTDYLTAAFGGGDLEDDSIAAFAMAWVIDDDGAERERDLVHDDYDMQRKAVEEVLGEGFTAGNPYEAAARLTAVDALPDGTPTAIREGIDARQGSRLESIKAVIAAAEKATEDGNLWVRLFGGESVAGTMHGFANGGSEVVLGKPRPVRGDKNEPRSIPLREIAAASPFTGKWKRPPDRLNTHPLFRRFADELPPFISTRPQLWDALCPNCLQIPRLPWSSGWCWSCRQGVVRNQYSFLTTPLLQRLLEGRAEWQDLVISIEKTQTGSWEAAFKTPDGAYVQASVPLEPLKMAVEDPDRREAIIKLTQLADEGDFNLNPEAQGLGSWHVVGSQADR